VIIDGYVWLDAESRCGLGGHLYEALQQRIPIIGVAKTAYRGAAFAISVLRGESHSPLYVTAAGLSADLAAAGVRNMHGPYRLPTLLKRVDQLARQG
jgi:deoxyribonuclease V